jgi:hypothetical protein
MQATANPTWHQISPVRMPGKKSLSGDAPKLLNPIGGEVPLAAHQSEQKNSEKKHGKPVL